MTAPTDAEIEAIARAYCKAMGREMIGGFTASLLFFGSHRSIGETIRDPVENAFRAVACLSGQNIGRRKNEMTVSENTMRKWMRIPKPGQFRGEGEWYNIDDINCAVVDWEWNRDTGYLPTHEGNSPPNAAGVEKGTDEDDAS